MSPVYLQSLMTGLMYHRPSDHLNYLITCLEKVRTEGIDSIRWNYFVDLRRTKTPLPPVTPTNGKRHGSNRRTPTPKNGRRTRMSYMQSLFIWCFWAIYLFICLVFHTLLYFTYKTVASVIVGGNWAVHSGNPHPPAGWWYTFPGTARNKANIACTWTHINCTGKRLLGYKALTAFAKEPQFSAID